MHPQVIFRTKIEEALSRLLGQFHAGALRALETGLTAEECCP